MIRGIFVFLHRWIGLAMTIFLLLVGLTGSILAFRDELDHVLAPQFHATPRPGEPKLDLATLAERGEALVPPGGLLMGVGMGADSARIVLMPKMLLGLETGEKPKLPLDQKTGKIDMGAMAALMEKMSPADMWMFVDPWTGTELPRRKMRGELSEGLGNIISFIYWLHIHLTPIVPFFGGTILGIVAVLWTIDCFVGFYLTLPPSRAGFWRKWRPAFAIKRGAGAYRLNFDLHRASGLWLWAMLLVFAWSSVMFNMKSVYEPVMKTLFDFRSSADYRIEAREIAKSRSSNPHPSLGWRGALAAGEQLMAVEARTRGFAIGEPMLLLYDQKLGLYTYAVESDLAVALHRPGATVRFDGATGEMFDFRAPTGEHAGNTVEAWLKALHKAEVFGLPYKIFVCILGLVIAMLSVTGVYIWWKKRKARRFHKARGASSDASLEALTTE
ncbi:MAG TPA: PepSY-associated TM helix domain-containing protein [Methylosinus sp.]|jgi:uncharacterized iron-regulated membrane protein|uniref:PepSY-associated TM helix domain-containing protein n=1 Tax=Methylosinus sp. TaxID=427 RepID=UPI002F92B6C7